MARALTMHEQRVATADRAAYFAALADRRQRAAAVQAHFWVFEHAGDPGRFVEFTEAASEEILAAVSGNVETLGVWREVQGG